MEPLTLLQQTVGLVHLLHGRLGPAVLREYFVGLLADKLKVLLWLACDMVECEGERLLPVIVRKNEGESKELTASSSGLGRKGQCQRGYGNRWCPPTKAVVCMAAKFNRTSCLVRASVVMSAGSPTSSIHCRKSFCSVQRASQRASRERMRRGEHVCIRDGNLNLPACPPTLCPCRAPPSDSCGPQSSLLSRGGRAPLYAAEGLGNDQPI